MSTQKRYRDWKAPVLSKDSVENVAILDGIGPKFGWNVANWDESSRTLSLGSNNSTKQGSKYRYNVDRNGTLEVPTNGVVTPDGILTITTGDEQFVINDLSSAPQREVLIYATHHYVESEITTTTTFHIVPLKYTNSWIDSIKASGTNMKNWLEGGLIEDNKIDLLNSVVIGVYKIPSVSGAIIEQAIPYHYSWNNGKSLGGNDGGGSFEFEIKDGSITTAKIAAGAVTTEKIANGAVTSSKIYDKSVTLLKLANRLFTFSFVINYNRTGTSTCSVSTSIDDMVVTATVINNIGKAVYPREHLNIRLTCTYEGVKFGIIPYGILPIMETSRTALYYARPGIDYNYIMPRYGDDLPVFFEYGEFAVISATGDTFPTDSTMEFRGMGIGTIIPTANVTFP